MSGIRAWTGNRSSRRRLLRTGATGAVGLTAATLLACGSDKSASTSGTETVRTLGTPPASQPKPGGRLTERIRGDPPNLSMLAASADTARPISMVYSKLLRMRVGYPDVPGNSTEIEDDLASKYEQVDELTVTFSLRPGVKWQNVPPVNGQPLTADQVKASMEAYRTDRNSAFRADWEPVERIETPDAQTIRIVTKTPFAPLLNTVIAGHYGARIFPVELLDGDKVKTQAVGTGPFVLESYRAGDALTFKKNAQYFRPGMPYLDEVVLRIIPDESSNTAAFQTDQADVTTVSCTDLEQIQRARPKTVQFEDLGTGGFISLNTTKPPFNDKRVRQALSIGFNRMAERAALFCGRGDFDQILPPGNVDKALRVKDLGPSAKNWEFNVAEGKKLLEAAGFASGFETSVVYTPQYGDLYRSSLERVISDWAQIGVRLRAPQSVEYSQWISSVYRPPYNFDGILWGPGRVYTDPEPYLWFWLHPTGITNQSRVNDQRATSLLEKQRRTLNVDERWNVIHEIERLNADELWYLHRNTGVEIWVTQPWVKNWGTEKQYAMTRTEHVWIDKG
jgi:peptide/nickel transport system substrate-binding protein